MSLRYVVDISGALETKTSVYLVSAIAWSVVYRYSPLEAIRLAFLMIVRDYLLTGVVIATILW